MALSAFSAACAQEPVTITFWHTYGDAETPVIDEVIIPMFEAANPDIKVEAVRQSGDFNQMLGLPLGGQQTRHLRELVAVNLENHPIFIADHCYGCTAGQGSSCGGALEATAIKENSHA